MPKIFWAWMILFLTATASAQTTTSTSCTLYPGAAYCTSTSNDSGALAAEQSRQQYETGKAIGAGIGMAIFRAHFPGWRRKYCSRHPSQPFYYANADGDSISGTCPTLDGLATEAAGEFVGKHPGAVKSLEHAAALEKYIANNSLPPWEPKSYEKALKAVPVPIANSTQAPTPSPVARPTVPEVQAVSIKPSDSADAAAALAANDWDEDLAQGRRYLHGKEVNQDFNSAAVYLERAARKGSPEAQFLIGQVAERGVGVLQDYVTAHMWLNLAAAGGIEQARAARVALEAKMTQEQIAEAQERARAFSESSKKRTG